MITQFFETVTVRWSGGNILLTVDVGSEQPIIALATESPLNLWEDLATGRWWLQYEDGGARVLKYSDNRGATWQTP